MDSKGNPLELLIDICSVRANTEGDPITTFIAETSNETGNEVNVELEVESNKTKFSPKVVPEEELSGKSTDKIQIHETQAADRPEKCSVSMKSNEITITSSKVDLKVDVDLNRMVNVDSGTASNPGTVTDVTIVSIADSDSVTKNNPIPVKYEASERNKLGKRKPADNEIIFISSGSDTEVPTTSTGPKTKQARTDPTEEKKRFIQLIRSYPVLYDSKHSDVKIIGSKKAAYLEIANKMGLSHKQVSTRWYNYYKTYKTKRSDPLLSFLSPFIDESEASSSGTHSHKAKDENARSFESSDESSNKSKALSPTSHSEKTSKVHFGGLSDESASETEKDSDSDDMIHVRPYFQIPMKKSSKKDGNNNWDIPDDEFIVLIRETIVGLDRAERKQMKKRIAKIIQL